MPRNEEKVLSGLLKDDVNLRLVEPHIYSVLPDTNIGNSYDKRFGDFYDRVACNPVYNRLIWGYSTSKFESAASHALTSSKKGNVLDLGCGSLAFTARTYAQYSERPVVFFDQSLKLLKMARKKLDKMGVSVPSGLVFLQGDALQLPFRPNSFETVISLNLLHVFHDVNCVLMGMKNVLAKNGNLLLTTLVENHRISDKYLKMWERKGEVVCRNIMLLKRAFKELNMHIEYHVVGNMAFIFYTKKSMAETK